MESVEIIKLFSFVTILVLCIIFLFFIYTLDNKNSIKSLKKKKNKTNDNPEGDEGENTIITFVENNEYSSLNSKKEQENGGISSIKLGTVYTSLFVEDKKLKSEQIHITKQDDGIVEGEVILLESNSKGSTKNTYTYKLYGKFTNKILTAEYYSSANKIDERGAINLKLIDSDVLSGFCSFSKITPSEDEIRVSPYIWVEGDNIDLLNGSFDFCAECLNEDKVCCCSNEAIDMPVFLESEWNNMRNHLAKRNTVKDTCASKLKAPYDNSSIRQINRSYINQKDDGTMQSKCYFFDLDSKKCKIYGGRPIDCKLFPFDIKQDKDSEYIIIYYTDLCERQLPEHNVMKKYAHILRPYFFLLYPHMHVFTSDVVCERLKSAEYRKIANFKDFVF